MYLTPVYGYLRKILLFYNLSTTSFITRPDCSFLLIWLIWCADRIDVKGIIIILCFATLLLLQLWNSVDVVRSCLLFV